VSDRSFLSRLNAPWQRFVTMSAFVRPPSAIASTAGILPSAAPLSSLSRQTTVRRAGSDRRPEAGARTFQSTPYQAVAADDVGQGVCDLGGPVVLEGDATPWTFVKFLDAQGALCGLKHGKGAADTLLSPGTLRPARRRTSGGTRPSHWASPSA